MSLRQQAAYFGLASVVLHVHGAALANYVFLPKQVGLLLLLLHVLRVLPRRMCSPSLNNNARPCTPAHHLSQGPRLAA